MATQPHSDSVSTDEVAEGNVSRPPVCSRSVRYDYILPCLRQLRFNVATGNLHRIAAVNFFTAQPQAVNQYGGTLRRKTRLAFWQNVGTQNIN